LRASADNNNNANEDAMPTTRDHSTIVPVSHMATSLTLIPQFDHSNSSSSAFVDVVGDPVSLSITATAAATTATSSALIQQAASVSNVNLDLGGCVAQRPGAPGGWPSLRRFQAVAVESIPIHQHFFSLPDYSTHSFMMLLLLL
jgi:hypothetical protein